MENLGLGNNKKWTQRIIYCDLCLEKITIKSKTGTLTEWNYKTECVGYDKQIHYFCGDGCKHQFYKCTIQNCAAMTLTTVKNRLESKCNIFIKPQNQQINNKPFYKEHAKTLSIEPLYY